MLARQTMSKTGTWIIINLFLVVLLLLVLNLTKILPFQQYLGWFPLFQQAEVADRIEDPLLLEQEELNKRESRIEAQEKNIENRQSELTAQQDELEQQKIALVEKEQKLADWEDKLQIEAESETTYEAQIKRWAGKIYTAAGLKIKGVS